MENFVFFSLYFSIGSDFDNDIPTKPKVLSLSSSSNKRNDISDDNDDQKRKK